MPEKKRLAVYNLIAKTTRTIGVIVPRLDGHFIAAALEGIQQATTEIGYDIIITHSQESVEKEVANTRLLFDRKVDGVLASLSAETTSTSHFTPFIAKGTPVVFFDRVAAMPGSARVIVDKARCGYLATEHLIGQGCRRIVIARGDTGTASGEAIAKKVLRMRPLPDGLFIANDQAAVACMHILMEAGIRVPGNIAIVGFNNDPVGRLITPALTTIDCPGFEIGRTAASTLLHQLSNRTAARRRITAVMPPALIIRNSSLKNKADLCTYV